MENGCLVQVVLAIGTLVTIVVAVTVEENQTLSLSLGLANVVSRPKASELAFFKEHN